MRTPRLALGVLLSACLVPANALASGGIGDFDQAGNPLMCETTGRVDSGWGFSVEVPRGLKGCIPDPHGIAIPLGLRNEDRILDCSGSYNATDTEDVSESAQSFIEYSLSNSLLYSSVQLVSRKKTRLAHLPAERVLIRYKEKNSPAEMILDTVMALSPKSNRGTAPSYDYNVSLTTSLDKRQQDTVIFESFLRSWKLEKPLM